MVHLHPVLERGPKTSESISVTHLEDLGLNGQEVSGSLLGVEFGNALINCVTDPGVTIFGVIEADHP